MTETTGAETTRTDIAIIGGGIAGASLAFRLAPHRRVMVLEREAQPGYHTTGRSAASLSENLGTPVARALTAMTRPFFTNPPAGFTPVPLMAPLGWLFIAREDQRQAYEASLAEARATSPRVRELGREGACALHPLLRPDYVAHAYLEPDAMALDVDAILQAYYRAFRAAGGRLVTGAEVRALSRHAGAWRIETKAGTIEAPVVVNAAGAWAEAIGRLAGVKPIGLVPKRRTAMILDAPPGVNNATWPELDCAGGEFYLKPEAGKFLASPCDETPSEPTDAQPDELDVAICVDRVEQATTLKVRRVERRWAGLRSFVADRNPVAGFAPEAEGFFWLAGQGGVGIQTSAGLSETAASLILGREWPAPLKARGIAPDQLSPARAMAAAPGGNAL
ncbi:MAG: FAD-binding oxidoreductase [Alphaproteobacteria bacterium]|nr:FAD-binding oxidoreductase [Alphaproteobacteria bacterium]